MPAADLVIQGTVLTVDDLQPTAGALAVSDGRVVAVGNRSDIESWIGPETQTLELGDGCVMPGFVEAHGHPLMEAIVLSDRMVDIRPVTIRKADGGSTRSATRWPRVSRRCRPQRLGSVAAERIPSRRSHG
jgi:predicted amidohydrolase YtcJ